MALGTGVVAAVAAYLLGAVPSGLIVSRLVAGVDVRQYGSGRTGATNVARAIGWGPAVIVLLADALKGLLALWVGRLFVGGAVDAYPFVDAIAGIAVLVGHNWPIYVGFRGGRGVATGIGIMLAVSPVITVAGVLVAILVVLLTDIVALGSVASAVAAVVLVLAAIAQGALPAGYVVLVGLGALLIIVRHVDNLGRALRGQERRIGLRPKVAAALRRAVAGGGRSGA
ncbi:MAG: glycerol-3-phosphate 1-O-acyltransferase PlsY [Chloroflexi bacterium]|nr:glycerol-3-phosphate 1-O-acyltransferase PlsY [Chloroflexota bacterium]